MPLQGTIFRPILILINRTVIAINYLVENLDYVDEIVNLNDDQTSILKSSGKTITHSL